MSDEIKCDRCGSEIFPLCPQSDYRPCGCGCHGLRHVLAKCEHRITALEAEIAHHAKDCHPTIERLEGELREARYQLTMAQSNNRRRNLELDALHYVWCDGGCQSGVHRFGEHPPLTAEMVATAENQARRLRSWFINRAGRSAPPTVEARTPVWRQADAEVHAAQVRELEAELQEARSINHWQELTRSISHLKKDLEASNKELQETRRQLAEHVCETIEKGTHIAIEAHLTAQLQVAREALDYYAAEDMAVAVKAIFDMDNIGTCTCGSGTHPRKCATHPCQYDIHVKELQYESVQEEVTELRDKLKAAREALEIYATKTTMHSIRNGYAVFNSPGPELAATTIKAIDKE